VNCGITGKKEVSMPADVYQQLALHLSVLGMGYPPGNELEAILKENFSPDEAAVVLCLPTRVAPLTIATVEELSGKSGRSREEISELLESLAARGLLYSGVNRDGKRGYGLQQIGYGFPQSFFWKGEITSQSRHMAELIRTYHKATNLNFEVYGTTETKNYRYIPPREALERPQDDHSRDRPSHFEHDTQALLPFDQMETVIDQAQVIAVSHCSCRVTMDNFDRRRCDHALEVCLKYDDLAEYVVDRKLGRVITKDEAFEIIRQCEDAGLVHMVDNSQKQMKHSCNCCPCCCWSVGTLKRRRIPRDVLIAIYFIRGTIQQECIGCGECAEVCPVEAIIMRDDHPVVDTEWCIGCGLCIRVCPTSAATLRRKTPLVPPRDFDELHVRILEERGLK